jgi:hypothetical protein
MVCGREESDNEHEHEEEEEEEEGIKHGCVRGV